MFFFFSSRRRHTRLQGDWSSDVCSSDLDAVGDRSAAGAARGRANIGGDHRSGSGRNFTVQPGAAIHGLRRNRAERTLQWKIHAQKWHYKNGERASAEDRGGIGLVLPPSAERGNHAAPPAGKSKRRN